MTSNTQENQLMEILLEEIAAYDYLAEVLLDKQKAIVANQMEAIEHHSSTEKMIVRKANQLTETRRQLMSSVVKTGEEPASFQALHTHFPGQSGFWERMQTRTERVIARIMRLNNENRQLLEASVSFVRDMIHLFYPRQKAESAIYSPQGQKTGTGYANLVDYNI